jgi:hypothetical protein
MAYNEHLASRIRNILGPASGVEEKKMFGDVLTESAWCSASH